MPFLAKPSLYIRYSLLCSVIYADFLQFAVPLHIKTSSISGLCHSDLPDVPFPLLTVYLSFQNVFLKAKNLSANCKYATVCLERMNYIFMVTNWQVYKSIFL